MNNERVICTNCRHELPIANFSIDNDNPVQKVFYGRIKLEYATALLLFQKKGNVQKLMHQLKYRGHREISEFLGKWMGANLVEAKLQNPIDAVIPVPLHKKKLRSRGFNQVEDFGKEIARSLGIPYMDDVLLKRSFTTTQTFKARLSRWGNIEETFVLAKPQLIHNKHVLIVDDIITTGATVEACSTALQAAGGVKISIASMALTV